MSIEKMMCLSTAHITEKTAEEFNLGLAMLAIEDPNEREHDVSEWMSHLTVYPHGDYGWLICIAGDIAMDEEFRQAGPAELLAVIAYADDNGCEWVLLDRDADLIDELPNFDW
jgi:hypothetical protein